MMSPGDRRTVMSLLEKYQWIGCSPEFIEDDPICTHVLCIFERAM